LVYLIDPVYTSENLLHTVAYLHISVLHIADQR